MRFVFGVGIALSNYWDLISEYFGPDYALDNNEQKWDKTDSVTGLYCFNPDVLGRYENAEVLITIGDPYIIKEVTNQLAKYDIKIYTLVEELEAWSLKKELPLALSEKLTTNSKKIVLFNTPEHNNIGDHLIALATLDLLDEFSDEYAICDVSDAEYLRYHNQISAHVAKEDIILVCGGGYMGSLWLYNGELNIRNIIEEYADNRIIVLPQTVFFEKNVRGENEYIRSQEIYSSHKNVVFCAREKKSYEILYEMIGNRSRVALLPDLALLYKKRAVYEKNNYVAVCLRNDKEKIADDKKQVVMNVLLRLDEDVKEISMHTDNVILRENREQYVEEKIKEIGGASVVVTDTLHCMISAALTGTPCIAFDNVTGKVKNVYEWIKELDYIYFCDNVSEFEKVLCTVSRKQNKYVLKDGEVYKDMLVGIIKGKGNGK